MTLLKWLMASALTLALPTAALAADSAQDGVSINGSVANTCTLGIPTQTASNQASLDAGATTTSASVSFTNLANPADASYTGTGSSVTLRFAGMCNYASNLALQSTNGSMTNTDVGVVPGSLPFADKVFYTAMANWSTFSSSIGAFDVPGIKFNTSIPGALLDDIDVSITLFGTNSAGNPLLSGNFTDTLTVQIGAAL